MTGKTNLTRAVQSMDDRKVSKRPIYSGLLGAFVNGIPVVPVANRPGMVYVRLRDNEAEIIHAMNSAVSNIYNLPVLVTRDDIDISKYRVIGRDVARYEEWTSAYISEHNTSHTFGSGGDVTWIFSQQFMPLLAYPSGSAFADALVIDRYNYLYGTTWRQVGGTSLGGFSGMNPTGAFNARAVLVYLQMDTGLFKIATGTMSEFLGNGVNTGTALVLSHLPTPPRTGVDIPIAGVRLVTGTTVLSWANLYDVRPFFQPSPTGTSSVGGGGGGSGYPTGAFTQGSVPFGNAVGSLTENNTQFFWDNASGILLLGDKDPANASSTARIILSPLGGAGTNAGIQGFAYGAGSFNYINTFHARGTKAAKTATQSGDSLFRIQSRGYGATGYAGASRGAIYIVANENWTDSKNGTQVEIYATETGSSTLNRVSYFQGDALFIEKGLKVNANILNYDDSEFTLTPKTAVIQRLVAGSLTTGGYDVSLPYMAEALDNLIIIHRGERDEGDDETVQVTVTGKPAENFADTDEPTKRLSTFETLFLYTDGFKWFDLSKGASKVRGQERFYREGVLLVDNGAFHLFNRTHRKLRIWEVHGVVDQNPTGDDIIVDVFLDGNSIFANVGDMLHIPDGDVTGATVVFQNDVWDLNQEMRIDVTNVGSIIPGANLVVTIVYE